MIEHKNRKKYKLHKIKKNAFLKWSYVYIFCRSKTTGSIVNLIPPPPGEENQLIPFEGENMKRGREKRGKCEVKRRKDKR
jgi:hypothetical protein